MGQLFHSGTDAGILFRPALMRWRSPCAMDLRPFCDADGGRLARGEPVSTEARALRVDGALDGSIRNACAEPRGEAGSSGHTRASREAYGAAAGGGAEGAQRE